VPKFRSVVAPPVSMSASCGLLGHHGKRDRVDWPDASSLQVNAKVSLCCLLTDALGTQLVRWCPLLRHVDVAELQSVRLSETDDAGLKAIGEGCSGLREFSLWISGPQPDRRG
jgi:hypothetical protein